MLSRSELCFFLPTIQLIQPLEGGVGPQRAGGLILLQMHHHGLRFGQRSCQLRRRLRNPGKVHSGRPHVVTTDNQADLHVRGLLIRFPLLYRLEYRIQSHASLWNEKAREHPSGVLPNSSRLRPCTVNHRHPDPYILTALRISVTADGVSMKMGSMNLCT